MAKNSEKKKKKKRQRLGAADFDFPPPHTRRISELDDDPHRLLRFVDAAHASNAGLQQEELPLHAPQNDAFAEHGSAVIDTLLSLHRLKESGRDASPLDNEEPNLHILVQSAVDLSEGAKDTQRYARRYTNAVQREALKNLRDYIWNLDGVLGEGWEVEIYRRSGKVDKFYISPDQQRFRSRVEVAKHLGVFGNSAKRSKKGQPAPIDGSGVGLDLLAYGRSDRKISLVLSDSKDTQVRNVMHDATNFATRTLEGSHSQGSQLHAQDRRTHIEREESGSQSQNDELQIPAQSCDQISEMPKFGQMKRYDTVEAMQEAEKWLPRQEVPSAALLTQRCQDVLRDIISAEKFGALKNVLNRWSPLGSIDAALQFNAPMLMSGTLDLQLISLRLASGVYGQTPDMFSTDMQQVWRNISSVGNELVTLAKALSELSYNLYKQQVVNLFPAEYEGHGPGSSHPLDEVHQQEQEPLLHECDHHKQSVDCNEAFLGDSQIALPHQALEAGSQKLNSSHCDKATGRQNSEQPIRMWESVSPQNLTAVISESSCKRCGLKQGASCIGRVQSNAGCPTYCIFPISASFTESVYRSTACTAKSAMGHIHKVSGAKGIREASNGAKELSLMPKQNADETCKSSREASNIKWTGGVCKELEKDDGNLLVPDTCDATDHMKCLNPDGHHCAVCDKVCTKSIIPLKTELPKGPVVSNHANVCKLCGFDAGKTSIISCSGCGKIYHLPCTWSSIKKFPKGIWFFPLCLCRVCRMDVNDEKTLHCEHCDKFCHTDCLGPHLADVPEGSWFCPFCVELQNPAVIATPLDELVGTCSESKKMTEVFKRKRKSKVPRRSW